MKISWKGDIYDTDIDVYENDGTKGYWGYTLSCKDKSGDILQMYSSGIKGLSETKKSIQNIIDYGLVYSSGSYSLDSKRWRNKDKITY